MGCDAFGKPAGMLKQVQMTNYFGSLVFVSSGTHLTGSLSRLFP
ncbi:hypothetical protein PHOSAC3_121053 [Mesotoga infera]|nr:hypothetical protein PHOSAC3_121053 [Mesotoga infera]